MQVAPTDSLAAARSAIPRDVEVRIGGIDVPSLLSMGGIMSKPYALTLAVAVAVMVVPQAGSATMWQALAGAQNFDEAIQVEAFLPNELWVHAGDSITWTFPAG